MNAAVELVGGQGIRALTHARVDAQAGLPLGSTSNHFRTRAALVAGLVFLRGAFVRRMKWELALLVVVLALAMLPSANVFRWSFRWLPLFHLVLALVAAEALAQFRLKELWRWLATNRHSRSRRINRH